MNSKVAVVLLVAICALLGVGLLMTHNQALKDKEANEATLSETRQQVVDLQGELDRAKAAAQTILSGTSKPAGDATAQANEPAAAAPAPTPTEPGNELQAALANAQSEAQAAQAAVAKAKSAAEAAEKLLAAERDKAALERAEAKARLDTITTEKDAQIAKLDEQIKKLSSDKAALNKTVETLNGDIGTLNGELGRLKSDIAAVQQELATTKSDKEFLLGELKRMQAEQDELEGQMNDLEFVREQLSKLKSERNTARRLDWIRRGILNRKKGAQILAESVRPSVVKRPKAGEKLAPSPLEVELHKDGTVKIKSPAKMEQKKDN